MVTPSACRSALSAAPLVLRLGQGIRACGRWQLPDLAGAFGCRGYGLPSTALVENEVMGGPSLRRVRGASLNIPGCGRRFHSSHLCECAAHGPAETPLPLCDAFFTTAQAALVAEQSAAVEAPRQCDGEASEDAKTWDHVVTLWATMATGIIFEPRREKESSTVESHATSGAGTEDPACAKGVTWWLRRAVAMTREHLVLACGDAGVTHWSAAQPLLLAQTMCAIIQSPSFHSASLRMPRLVRPTACLSTATANALLFNGDGSPAACIPQSCIPSEPLGDLLVSTSELGPLLPLIMREVVFAFLRERLIHCVPRTRLHAPRSPQHTTSTASQCNDASCVHEDSGTVTESKGVALACSNTDTSRRSEKIFYQLMEWQQASARDGGVDEHHALVLVETADAILALAPPVGLHPFLHTMALPLLSLCSVSETLLRSPPSTGSTVCQPAASSEQAAVELREQRGLTHSSLATLALVLARCGPGGTYAPRSPPTAHEEHDLSRTEVLVPTITSFTLLSEAHVVAEVVRQCISSSWEILCPVDECGGGAAQPPRLHFSLKAKKEYERAVQARRQRHAGAAPSETGSGAPSEEQVLLLCDLAEICSALSSMRYKGGPRHVPSRAAQPGKAMDLDAWVATTDRFWGDVALYVCRYVEKEMQRAASVAASLQSTDGAGGYLDVCFTVAELRAILFAIDFAGPHHVEYDAVMKVLIKWDIVPEYIPPPSAHVQGMKSHGKHY